MQVRVAKSKEPHVHFFFRVYQHPKDSRIFNLGEGRGHAAVTEAFAEAFTGTLTEAFARATAAHFRVQSETRLQYS
jgi:hypothetical protein